MLSSLWSERPVALVFLRHLGCIFCKQHVAKISKHPELNVVFVCASQPANAAVFRATVRSPFPFISDPQYELYIEAGLSSAFVVSLLSFRVIGRGIGAMREGFRNSKPDTDPLILGGSFVIDRSGAVVWAHRAKDVSDNASVEDIAAALASLKI